VPFKGEDANDTLLNRLQEKAKPLAEIDPHISKPISNLVGKCLERSRDARYQTVQELLSDLRAWLHPARRTWRWAAAAALVSVLVATQVLVQQKLAHKGGAQHPPVSVLVADFKNDTGEAVFDGTLEPAFGVDLEGASFITGYNRAQAHKVLARLRPGTTVLDDQSARLVAARENINVVVSGEISRKRNNYDVQVNAIDPLNGKSLVRADRVTDKKGVLLALSKLAARVRKTLGDTTPESKQLTAAENFTTQSLDAAHEYASGQEEAVAGKWDAAMQHWQRATQLDPEMGRAYAGLGNAYFNTGKVQQAQKYYQLALSKIDRMSDREKYRTRGTYYLMMRDTDKALEQQLQLVKDYPSDNAGIFNLALAYFYRRDMGRALEVGRQALAIYPQNLLARNNVGLFAMYAGQFDAAIAEQTAVIKTNPGFALGYVGLALSQLGEGRPAEAVGMYQILSTSAGAQGKSAASLGLADVALYQGRTSDAIKILEEGVESDLGAKNVDAAAVKLGILAQAYAAAGRSAAAVRAADRALTLSKQTGVMFWAARAYIAAKQPAKALRIAQQLGSGLETDPQAYAKLIEGEADLSAGKPREAIKLFLESRKLADTWMGRLDAGETYIELKAYEEAESDLDVCLKRRGEATALFLDENPSYLVFPPAYYYLARAQEGLKSPAAADSFKTFLAMKEKADPDPLIADTRRWLAKQ
jgi:eukaryotic-like serine/threonine-protein kinase